MRNKLSVLSILAFVGLVSCNPDCRFAPSFTQQQLLTNASAVAEFKQQILAKEAAFMREVGYDKESGLAKPAVRLNPRTGMPEKQEGDAYSMSATTTDAEAVHIGVLASSISGDERVYSKEEALKITKKKIQSLTDKVKNHPKKDSETSIQNYSKEDMAHGHASLYWSLQALAESLNDNYSDET
jgi:hypothetical protein